MKKTIILPLLIILSIQLTSALNIFTESFESGSLSGWTLSSASGANNWTASTTDPHTGTWHANANPRSTTEPAAVLQKAISTSEYQNITFSYYRRLIGIDAGDEFQVEWFNGTTWTILESTGGASANDASYLYREFNLSIQVNDNQNFQIKFECTAGATTEHCRVDNVNITGNLMPDTSPPSVSLLSPPNGSTTSTNLTYFNAHFTDNRNATNTTLYIWNSTTLIGTNFTVLGNSSISMNLSFTLPRGGTYFWNYLTYDSSTNSAFNLTNFTLTFNPPETIPPNITSLTETPTDSSAYSQNAKYEFNATITDNTAISSVIIEFNGINYTATNLTNSLFNFTISNLAAGVYSYYWRANDTLNNINVTETFTYTVNKAQSQLNLTLNNTEGNITIIQGTSIYINASLISGDQSKIQLYKNGTLINNGTSPISNLTLFDIAGLYNITIIYPSSQNYTESSKTYFVNVTPQSDLTPPNITSLIPVQNSQFNLSQIIEISANINDESSIDTVIANITFPNSTIYLLQLSLSTSNKYNNSFTIPSNLIGRYNITFIANDSLNNINSTEKTFFIVNDIIAPSLTLVHPQNISYNTNSLQINFTISDTNLDSCWYTDNNGQTNTSLTNCQNISYTAAQGSTTLNLYANDSSNNINSSSVTFFVDSIIPLISYTSPTETNNSLIKTRNIVINISATDTNLANITIFLSNSTSLVNQTTTTSNNNFINITNLSDGTYYFNATATDILNNKNSTETRTVLLDSTTPLISFTAPTNPNNSILAHNSILINTTITETNFANITFSLHNSTSLINQTTFTTQITTINFSSLQDGIYFYNVTIKDILNNQNTTETRTITLDTLPPSLSIISPQNITYFNTSILINISSNGDNIWFFNTTTNETYTSPVYRTLDGSNTIIAYANDSAGNINSSSITFYATEINLNCEVGGPYQQGALILVQGNLSNKTSPLNSQQINVTIYKNNLINLSKILTTSNDGSFETSITNISTGNYILNATTSYLQSNRSCTDNFQIGSQASLIISKIASIYNTTNETIYYNITLKLTNNGGSDTLNTNITDSDSESSPYLIGTLSPSSSYQTSYLKNFTRQSSTTYYLTSIATALGIDSYSNSLLTTNSTQINLTIPPTQVGKQLVITKNILYISENSLNITYNITSTIFNSGDEDLTNINYIDTDISDTATLLNLTKSSSKTLSNTKTIAKAASNTQHEFVLGTATISSLNFYSNRPKINIPGYGGPADVIVYAPSSLNPSASFDSIIEIKNVNPDIGQDFPIVYWITSNEETQNYSSGQKTIYIGANSSVNTTITLTSPATAGIYKLKAQATWAGGLASAFDSFEVSSTKTTQQPPSSEGGSSSSSGSIISPQIKKPIPEEKTEEKQKETEIICNPPYIRHGLECCLDTNSNQICDNDEKPIPEEPKKQNFLTTITGFFIKNTPDIKTINKFIILLIWLILAIALILLVIYLKKKKQKHINRLTHLKGIRVYTSDGIEIGRIKEIFIENHKIHSIQIKLSKKLKKNKKFKPKGIYVNYKYIDAIKEIIIINHKIIEKI